MSDSIVRFINKIVGKLESRIMNMMVRGVITAINDQGGLQIIQATGLADEVLDNAERVQQYGFTSNPPAGSEIVALFVGGNRDHPVIIAVDNRDHRLKELESGDSALYSLAGNYIRLQAEDGKIYIDAPHNVIIRSDEVIRLEGRGIEVSASEYYKHNVGGRGYIEYPTHTDTYDDCSVPGTSYGCVPPEFPPDPAD